MRQQGTRSPAVLKRRSQRTCHPRRCLLCAGQAHCQAAAASRWCCHCCSQRADWLRRHGVHQEEYHWKRDPRNEVLDPPVCGDHSTPRRQSQHMSSPRRRQPSLPNNVRLAGILGGAHSRCGSLSTRITYCNNIPSLSLQQLDEHYAATSPQTFCWRLLRRCSVHQGRRSAQQRNGDREHWRTPPGHPALG